jgi:DNA polymerase-3 subunit gamma/tau
VASTKPAVAQTVSPAPQGIQDKVAASTQTQPAATPAKAIKAASLGFSWSNLRNQDKPSKMNIIPGSIADTKKNNSEDVVFTQDELEFQWMSMCNRMPQQYSGIATRMKNMNPVITQMPQVEVVVNNALIKQEMEAIVRSIVKTLQVYLHNNQISLNIVVSEKGEQSKLLTRKEQFETMSKENPAVEKLRQVFNLVLA